MSKTDFLTKQNVSLLWEVIMDNDFMKNKPQNEVSQIIDIFNVNLKKFHDSTNNNNLTELNKNYITVMMNFINKNFNKPTPTPPNEKKLVTYEELQNDRLSKFEKDFFFILIPLGLKSKSTIMFSSKIRLSSLLNIVCLISLLKFKTTRSQFSTSFFGSTQV